MRAHQQAAGKLVFSDAKHARYVCMLQLGPAGRRGVSHCTAVDAPANAAISGASRATQSACASSAPVSGGAAPRAWLRRKPFRRVRSHKVRGSGRFACTFTAATAALRSRRLLVPAAGMRPAGWSCPRSGQCRRSPSMHASPVCMDAP